MVGCVGCIGCVGLKLQEVAPSRAYAPNPLDLRSGRSESSASQSQVSRVKPSTPTRPAQSHLCPPFEICQNYVESQRSECIESINQPLYNIPSLLGSVQLALGSPDTERANQTLPTAKVWFALSVSGDRTKVSASLFLHQDMVQSGHRTSVE
jgi:hypothetical protein